MDPHGQEQNIWMSVDGLLGGQLKIQGIFYLEKYLQCVRAPETPSSDGGAAECGRVAFPSPLVATCQPFWGVYPMLNIGLAGWGCALWILCSPLQASFFHWSRFYPVGVMQGPQRAYTKLLSSLCQIPVIGVADLGCGLQTALTWLLQYRWGDKMLLLGTSTSQLRSLLAS